jgi:rSAM/selenodomain-associated transferase 2
VAVATLISVLIPTLNESGQIRCALSSAMGESDTEIVVVDGGSEDDTVPLAKAQGARVLSSPRGRATQMNVGAVVARGEILLFLHADTRLPKGFAGEVRQILANGNVAAGAFRLCFDGRLSPAMRFVQWTANIRARRFQMPFGDQGIFLRKELFLRVGGFPQIPIMEDVELVRRLRKLGRIVILDSAAVTSARRYATSGAIRRALINKAVFLSYQLGVSPRRIVRWYEGGWRRR